ERFLADRFLADRTFADRFLAVLYLHTTPKGDVIFDLLGCRLGIRIVPSSILIFLSVNEQGVIARLPLPWAGRCSRTGAEILPIYGSFREIGISFYSLNGVTLGDHLSIPYCFCHFFFRS